MDSSSYFFFNGIYSSGFCSSSKSLYISAITEALSISRSTFSINDSCRYIATSIVNLFFGVLIGRFGARKLIAAGFDLGAPLTNLCLRVLF